MELRNRPIFMMLCGLPGSGKSTWAENNKGNLDFTIHSSDAIRAEFGDVNDQSKNELVFNTLHKRIKEDLRDGKNVAYDATSLSRKRRIHFLSNELRDISCKKVCVLFATPYEVCLKNNANRERKVPEEVIERMIKNFEVPCKQEGWDEIHIVWWDWKKDGLEFDILSDMEEFCEISHDNPHHTKSIGNHMFSAYCHYIRDNIGNVNNLLADCILLHDCGKPHVKSYVDKDGNIGARARYYEHHNVGSYNSLFYLKETERYTDEEILYGSLLIGLHMRHFMAWKDSDKAKEKDRRLFGDDTIKLLEVINRYDLAAH